MLLSIYCNTLDVIMAGELCSCSMSCIRIVLHTSQAAVAASLPLERYPFILKLSPKFNGFGFGYLLLLQSRLVLVEIVLKKTKQQQVEE